MKDGRIALEVLISRGNRVNTEFVLVPWFCFLDTWNGYELAGFINSGQMHPALTASNMPLVVHQLWIERKVVA